MKNNMVSYRRIMVFDDGSWKLIYSHFFSSKYGHNLIYISVKKLGQYFYEF